MDAKAKGGNPSPRGNQKEGAGETNGAHIGPAGLIIPVLPEIETLSFGKGAAAKSRSASPDRGKKPR